jgi:hypothetical protein
MKIVSRHMFTMVLTAALLGGCAGSEEDAEPADESSADAGEENLGQIIQAVVYNRHSLGPYGSCHTHGWLRDQAYWKCNDMYAGSSPGSEWYAYDFNYTYPCGGWWGAGAKKIWFSCWHK